MFYTFYNLLHVSSCAHIVTSAPQDHNQHLDGILWSRPPEADPFAVKCKDRVEREQMLLEHVGTFLGPVGP